MCVKISSFPSFRLDLKFLSIKLNSTRCRHVLMQENENIMFTILEDYVFFCEFAHKKASSKMSVQFKMSSDDHPDYGHVWLYLKLNPKIDFIFVRMKCSTMVETLNLTFGDEILRLELYVPPLYFYFSVSHYFSLQNGGKCYELWWLREYRYYNHWWHVQ